MTVKQAPGKVWNEIAKAAKAIYAAVVTGLAGLATVLVNDTGIGEVTDGQWVVTLGAMVAAGGGVYRITNRK